MGETTRPDDVPDEVPDEEPKESEVLRFPLGDLELWDDAEEAPIDAPDDDEMDEPSRFDGERLLRRIHHVLMGYEFDSDDELNQFLESDELEQEASALDGEMSLDESAQELAYLAMEAEDADRAEELAREAVALDPDCVDSRVVLAFCVTEEPVERIPLLRRAIDAGQRRLESLDSEEPINQFRLMIDTRPVLRAINALAECLADNGDLEEAEVLYEQMLELNPDDNDDAPYLYLAFLLRVGKVERARRVINRLPTGENPVREWACVLERFLSGAREEASTLCDDLNQRNFYVTQYLLQGYVVNDADSSDVEPESNEELEAQIVHHVLGEAWAAHPAALTWLRAR